MIKNDREFRITRKQADEFRKALEVLGNRRSEVDLELVALEIDSLRSQLHDLEGQLADYETLKTGRSIVEPAPAFLIAELPRILIEARISRGWTQRALAERLGLKEQQVQRYEATDYASASLSRLIEVARALGLGVPELSDAPTYGVEAVLTKLKGFGFDSSFVVNRLVPRRVFLEKEDSDQRAALLATSAARIFGWKPNDLLSGASLTLSKQAVAAGRFKAHGKDRQAVGAYVVYAHHLALLTLQATADLPSNRFSTNASDTHGELVDGSGKITLDAAIRYSWMLGIPVLPLSDAGNFHGACWRQGGRNVIILKQRTRSAARWLFDFLHELFHVGQRPEAGELSIIESLGAPVTSDNEEVAASRFAGDVLLDGRAEALVEVCVAQAGGSVERLKRAVQAVSAKERVSTSSLANYTAYRLSLQGINWWGVATNLQEQTEPWTTVRDIFLEHVDLQALSEPDRSILVQALEPLEAE